MSAVRVAAVQFEIGIDVAANLTACIRLIDAAAERGARLIVLPARCNYPAWHGDRDTVRATACRPGDDFLSAVAQRAARHSAYLKLNVALARDDGRTVAANLLFGPDGTLAGSGDEQTLVGHQRDTLDPADAPGPVCLTDIGRLGLYSSAEGLVSEVTRSLALRGAQILLNSLQSFAVDQAGLHVPVRAAENKVWVVAANAVGPLLPPDELTAAAARLGVPTRRLHGAGESQIVAPDGTVLAKAPAGDEAVIVADIEPGWADDKTRPDGTDLFAARRPAIYAPITAAPAAAPRPAAVDELTVAVVRPTGNGMTAIDDAADLVRRAAGSGADLIVLPELFSYPDGRADGSFLDGIAVDALLGALAGTASHVVTSLPDDSAHVGLLVSAAGVRGRQLQLHHSTRHIAWHAATGDGIEPFDLPWGRLAIVVGDDALYPETFRLAAIAGADVVAVPFTPYEPWELRLGLLERAAENRLNVVAAGHPGPGGAGVILGLPADYTMCAAPSGTFTGRVSYPLLTGVDAGERLTTGVIQPARSRNRALSGDTNLIDGRPWRLAGALVH